MTAYPGQRRLNFKLKISIVNFHFISAELIQLPIR